MELFQHILKQLPSLTSKDIRLHIDGEPTSHPNFFEMAKAVNDKGFKIALATNGSLLKEDYLSLDMTQIITLSTNAQEFAQRHKTMNFQRYLDRIIDYVKGWALEGKGGIAVQVPYLPERRTEPDYQQEKDKFIEKFIFKTGLRQNCDSDDKNKLAFLNMNGAKTLILKHHIVKMGLYPDNGVKNRYTPTIKGFCDSPWKRLAILADGRVGFCCIDLSGKTTFTKPDDIWKKSLVDLWARNESINNIRQKFLANRVTVPVCQTCLAPISENRRIVGAG